MIKLFIIIFIINILNVSNLLGQVSEIKLNYSGSSKPMIELINDLEKDYSINFYFDKSWIDSINITSEYKNKKLANVLEKVLSENNLFFVIAENSIYISKKPVNLKLEEDENGLIVYDNTNDNSENYDNTNNNTSYSGFKPFIEKITIGTKSAISKKYVNLIGTIKDAQTGEFILGASVYVEELKTGSVTDVNGNYMLSIEKGTYTLTFRSMGNETVQKNVSIYSDGRLNVDLKKNLIALDEIVVKEDKYNNTRGMQMGFEQISMKEIKELPPVAGERDVLKASLMLPGVQNIGESAAGYNIRGGAADQNLFLINHVPIFNTSHMFGFFSAFNSSVIRNFNLYKSNIPVEYGGRISSIFDIQTKNGNDQKFSIKGGISPITANVSVEGPIVKDKCSYILGARSTYSNWILKKIENPNIRNSDIFFYDFVANINSVINENNNVSFFGYYSQDNYRFPTDITYNYYNLGASVNWLHFFGKKLYSNLSIIFSNYHLKTLNKEIESNAYIYNHDLKYYEINHQFSYNPIPNHEFKFGYNSILYHINPGNYEPETEESTYNYLDIESETASESALYIGDKYDINSNLSVEAGIRYSFYNYLGTKTILNYIEGTRPSSITVSDTSYYNNLEPIKTYSNIDIRISARYLINSDNSIKMGYNRINQYLFMLTNTVAISPTDRWKLCDNYLSPITGEQYNIGYYKNFVNKNLEASAEIYYKNFKNMKEFKNGSDPEKNEFLERDLITGKGRAYGIEFMLKKVHGKLNGWINYTYSKSELKFNGSSYEEIINNGKFFPSNADKPHNVNLTANIKSNRRLSLSTNFTYSTGRPSTNPVSKYYLGSIPVINYSNRNAERLPDYWRVDVAINLEGNLLRKKIAHSYWTLSVYNLLGRKNAYSVYYSNENGKIVGHKISIFANPILTLTYNFKMGNYLSN